MANESKLINSIVNLYTNFEEYSKKHSEYRYLSDDVNDYASENEYIAYQNLKKQDNSLFMRRMRFEQYLRQYPEIISDISQIVLNESEKEIGVIIEKELNKVHKDIEKAITVKL